MIKKILAAIFAITVSSFFAAVFVSIPDFWDFTQAYGYNESRLRYTSGFKIGSMFFASFLSLIIIIILGPSLILIKKFTKITDLNYSLILSTGFTIGSLLNLLNIFFVKETIIPFTTYYSPAGYGHTWGGSKFLDSLGISLNNWELTTTLMMGLLGLMTSFILHKSLIWIKDNDYQNHNNNNFFKFIRTSFISSFFISTISVLVLSLLLLTATIVIGNNSNESFLLLILFNYFIIIFLSVIISLFLFTPSFFILERFNKLNWLSVIFVGFICALLLSLIKTHISFNVGINILIGIILSVSFYKTLLWSENRKAKKAQ